MRYTVETLVKKMEENGGSLYLSGTQITTLPEGLTVGGSLYLRGTPITTLPEGLTVGGLREVKEEYPVREIIELTRGQYNSEVFKRFFEGE